jgi:molecular chaperone HtpG
LQKYSNFVDFPLYVGEEKVNKVTALWHKRKDDISEDELNEFYKFISNDYQEPLGNLHLNIEGNINFKALLFVPKVAPPDVFRASQDKSIHLYSSKVFIQDDAKNLLPDYLKFLKGVVDTEDLPLNVSREVTQNSPVMAKIKSILTGKVLGLLEEWADKDKEKYETFYNNFGSLFKTGVNADFANKDRIVELLRFETTKTEAGELTSFNSYVARMGEANDNKIYYISGNTRESLETNPNLEYFRKNDIEVLLLTDPADIFTIPYINEYDGKQIVSIEKAEIKRDDNDESKLDESQTKSIIEYFKEVLGDEVEDVVESQRLVDSAVTLVVGKAGMDAHMEKMMQLLDKQFKGSKRILEINTSHGLIKNLASLLEENKESEILKESVEQLYQGALLIEGYIQKPSDFVKRMTEFMEKATSK